MLIQYVPHAFGLKAMNVPFATWVATRARRLAPVWVMFHEVSFPFVRRPLKHNLVAVVTRMMARSLAGVGERVFVSIPSWGPLISRLCPGAQPAEWLPVPCNVATSADPEAVAAVRCRHSPDSLTPLVGHFGTFGRSITALLDPAIVGLVRAKPLVRVVFIGQGSERYLADLVKAHPELGGRVSATGELSPSAVAVHLRACDLVLQPYSDGVSTRRTSVMAGLANRVPVVTNHGTLSEPLWTTCTGPTVVPGPDPAALAAASVEILNLPSASRLALGARGAELYVSDFTLERTIATLRCPRTTAAGVNSR
jgi:glycosyltransferase involved in cell wall biosynthesis